MGRGNAAWSVVYSRCEQAHSWASDFVSFRVLGCETNRGLLQKLFKGEGEVFLRLPSNSVKPFLITYDRHKDDGPPACQLLGLTLRFPLDLATQPPAFPSTLFLWGQCWCIPQKSGLQVLALGCCFELCFFILVTACAFHKQWLCPDDSLLCSHTLLYLICASPCFFILVLSQLFHCSVHLHNCICVVFESLN